MNRSRIKITILLAIMLFIFTMSSCWDSKELDGLTIVTGFCVDKADEGEGLKITLQIGEVQSKSGSGEEKSAGNESFFMISEPCNSINAGVFHIQQYSNGTLYLSHNQIIIFSEALAKDGLNKYYDYFLRGHDTRLDEYIMLSEGGAADVLQEEVEKGEIPAITLTDAIMLRKKTSESYAVTLLKLIADYMDETTCSAVPIVTTEKDNESTKFVFKEMGVLKNGKLVGTIDGKQTMGYLLAMGTMNYGSLDIVTTEGSVCVMVVGEKCKTEVVLNKDNQMDVYLDISLRLNIGEITGFSGTEMDDILAVINEELPKLVNSYINDCFSRTLSFNSDIYGFGRIVHHKYNKRWDAVKEQWDEIYPKTKLYTKIKLTVTESGQIKNSLDMVQ